jgi:VWFA-related protein
VTILRAIIVAVAAAGAARQERPPTFSVQVDGVRVDVQVTRRGRPLAGLGREDFELRDNGVVQTVDSVTREDVPLDLVLVLDTSGSVAGERLEALAAAARLAVNTLQPQDRIALLTFGHRLSGPARLSSDKAAVLAAIDRMPAASGATSLVDALYAALVLRQASPHRALIVVFTDGYDTSSWLPPSAVLNLARQTDAVVYAVALADSEPTRDSLIAMRSGSELMAGGVASPKPPSRAAAPDFLEELTAQTGGRVLGTSEPRKLRNLFSQAVRDMKTRYVLSYMPQGVKRDGWHALTVQLTRQKAEVTARRGYFIPPERKGD